MTDTISVFEVGNRTKIGTLVTLRQSGGWSASGMFDMD